MPLVMTLCGDPGGAEALAPVIKRMLADRRLEITCLAYRSAGRILAGHGLACQSLADASGESDLRRLFLERRPQAVLVATSFNGVDLEKALMRMARDAAVPSLALIDFWSHYRERFSDAAGELSYMPDRIAVMDEQARASMAAEGFDPARLAVTGQPALDAALVLGATRRLRTMMRRRWRVSPRTFVALYASQPSRFDHQSRHGLEHSGLALAMLARALSIFARAHRRKVLLVLRPHPRERRGPRTWRRRLVAVRPNDRAPKHAAALGCDAMFGKRTMLLVEARALGVPAFSVQPLGARGEIGGVPQVRTAAALMRKLAASSVPGPRSAHARPAYAAADRVAANLLDLMGLEPAIHA